MQMSKFFHGLYNLANDIVAFMLCLALFFGIASEASADCSLSPPRPSSPRCDRPCMYSASSNKCILRGGVLGLLGDDEDPADTLNSPNSDPLPPSSGAVAPPIGNPAP
jgi:hypothetical protein